MSDDFQQWKIHLQAKLHELDELKRDHIKLDKDLSVFKAKIYALAGAISSLISIALPILLDWIRGGGK